MPRGARVGVRLAPARPTRDRALSRSGLLRAPSHVTGRAGRPGRAPWDGPEDSFRPRARGDPGRSVPACCRAPGRSPADGIWPGAPAVPASMPSGPATATSAGHRGRPGYRPRCCRCRRGGGTSASFADGRPLPPHPRSRPRPSPAGGMSGAGHSACGWCAVRGEREDVLEIRQSLLAPWRRRPDAEGPPRPGGRRASRMARREPESEGHAGQAHLASLQVTRRMLATKADAVEDSMLSSRSLARRLQCETPATRDARNIRARRSCARRPVGAAGPRSPRPCRSAG
jgi:hypothetical protein